LPTLGRTVRAVTGASQERCPRLFSLAKENI
jgi:hypothetical protein